MTVTASVSGLPVGFAVGLALGFVVGLAVGLAVGLVLGLPVGFMVGLAVASTVGLAVGFTLGLSVGAALGSRGAPVEGLTVDPLPEGEGREEAFAPTEGLTSAASAPAGELAGLVLACGLGTGLPLEPHPASSIKAKLAAPIC
jgi:hypothetical protein